VIAWIPPANETSFNRPSTPPQGGLRQTGPDDILEFDPMVKLLALRLALPGKEYIGINPSAAARRIPARAGRTVRAGCPPRARLLLRGIPPIPPALLLPARRGPQNFAMAGLRPENTAQADAVVHERLRRPGMETDNRMEK
jgi:hypothetical protein